MNLTEFRAGMKAAMSGSISAKGKSLFSKPSSHARFQPTPTHLRSLLDGIHQRIRNAQTAAPMYDAVDEYVATAAQLAMALQSGGLASGANSGLSGASTVGGYIPGGAVLSAAISSAGSLKSDSGA